VKERLPMKSSYGPSSSKNKRPTKISMRIKVSSWRDNNKRSGGWQRQKMTGFGILQRGIR
jgi:hypothetical protein